MSDEKVISPDPPAAAAACGERVLEILHAAIEARGAANIAVSGGTTPKLLFQHLAAAEMDWSKVHLFWVDERAVPPGDPQSNYTLAHENWLQKVDFPAAHIHRIPAELPVSEAAERYAADILSHFHIADAAIPVFDVIQQGMGGDGHTASLFPGEPLVMDRSGIAAAVYVDKLRAARITLLPAVLAAARHTLLLVTGPDKTEALHRAWYGPDAPLETPVQLTRRHTGKVTWFLDEAAAPPIE